MPWFEGKISAGLEARRRPVAEEGRRARVVTPSQHATVPAWALLRGNTLRTAPNLEEEKVPSFLRSLRAGARKVYRQGMIFCRQFL